VPGAAAGAFLVKPELIRGFFPFARLSARAIDAVIAAGRNGIDGFYEVVWPTGTIAIWSSKTLLCGPAM